MGFENGKCALWEGLMIYGTLDVCRSVSPRTLISVYSY